MSDNGHSGAVPATRIVVQGTSGSGKSTLSVALAEKLGVAYLELDGVYQQPDWTPLDLDVFRARVTDFADQPGWVIDGNYSHVRDILWQRATTIVVIDLPRRTVMRRVIMRTLWRLVTRTQLWNGNRESWRNALSRDPMRNIILWAWGTHSRYHVDVPREAREAVGSDRVVVLTDPSQVRRFIDGAQLMR